MATDYRKSTTYVSGTAVAPRLLAEVKNSTDIPTILEHTNTSFPIRSIRYCLTCLWAAVDLCAEGGDGWLTQKMQAVYEKEDGELVFVVRGDGWLTLPLSSAVSGRKILPQVAPEVQVG